MPCNWQPASAGASSGVDAGGAPTLVERQIAEVTAAEDALRADPLVAAALAAFPDAEFVDSSAGARRAMGGSRLIPEEDERMDNIKDMMAAAQQASDMINKHMEEAQHKLDLIEVEGVSGGGLVKIRCSAKGKVNGVTVDESLLVPSEKTMLEDLVAAAFNDARTKADAAAEEEMRKVRHSIQLPPGFKLPF